MFQTARTGEAGAGTGGEAMRFGLFGGAQAPRGTASDPACGFHEFIETSIEAERLGFYSTFLVEHHFSGVGQVSSPLDLLGWVAARTRSIRPGQRHQRCNYGEPAARRRALEIIAELESIEHESLSKSLRDAWALRTCINAYG
jgi:hypothetical protein